MSARCSCGCCAGVQVLTPVAIANRPGLDALQYRVGTHATFLETMKARLSSADYPELRGLTTRAADDPAIALLDGWALVGDVLTFYQERIANEGYLRTATERRSVLELARLVGYALRPGVAASVSLAFTMEQGQQVVIPVGARSQSLPGPGELPQSFETSDPLDARAEWNTLAARQTQPQQVVANRLAGGGLITSINRNTIYVQGVATGLKVGDRLLFVFGSGDNDAIVQSVARVEAQTADGRTKVTLQEAAIPISEPLLRRKAPASEQPPEPLNALRLIREKLTLPAADHPANQFRLARDIADTLSRNGDVVPQLLIRSDAALGAALYKAWGRTTITAAEPPAIFVFRIRAALFGHNVLKPLPVGLIEAPAPGAVVDTPDWQPANDENSRALFLDNAFDQILTGSYVAVQRPDAAPKIFGHVTVTTQPRTHYGISANTTKISGLDADWWRPQPTPEVPVDPDPPFDAIRGTLVYAQSEPLTLANEPIDPVTKPVCGGTIELATVYGALQAGRWLIVAGERTDLLDAQGAIITGVHGAELVMLNGVTHDVGSIPGDTVHTFLQFSSPLTYSYRRDTVVIYGNVVSATHGETRTEVLGSGDPATVHQQFALRQSPLTYVSAPTSAGCASTLEVRVDDVQWHEIDNFNLASAKTRAFITQTDDDDKTLVTTGDGQRGARVPSGTENVTATYRTGIGEVGNVKAEQISLLVTRPLGLKKVVNPIAASGGADRDSRDWARRNAPLAMMALDRLVSVVDYEFFARTFAGIGKASAALLSDGHRQLVHLTIAGSNDAPVGSSSDLMANLNQALLQFGDPFVPIQVALRERLVLVLSANVRIDPDHRWELVEPIVRAALVDAFGFDRRDLGQPVFLSEVMSAIQQVPGVVAVDIVLFDSVSETLASQPAELADALEAMAAPSPPGPEPRAFIPVALARPGVECLPSGNGDQPATCPAQIALFSADVTATLTLTEWTTP